MAELNWDVDAFVESVRSDAYQSLLSAAGALQASAKQLCPVRSGRLRDSITVTGNGTDSVTVGSDLPYAAAVEFGHVEKLKDGGEKQIPAQPFLIPAFEEVKAALRDRGLEAFK
jgi:HK97 gp10 family phage protein